MYNKRRAQQTQAEQDRANTNVPNIEPVNKEQPKPEAS